MVESPFGRRGALATTTFVTALFCIIFAFVKDAFLVRASSVGISLSATVRNSLRTSFSASYAEYTDDVCCTIWVCFSDLTVRLWNT